jgi:hypothetical protein
MRRRIAAWAFVFNVALSAGALTVLASGVLAGWPAPGGNRVGDVALSALIWSYVLGTPALAAATCLVRGEASPRARLTWGLLALWLTFVVWTSTMTMRA